jgi:hypothetical protein
MMLMINIEWNDPGNGITVRYGFDIFRWKWITYHQEGRLIDSQAR